MTEPYDEADLVAEALPVLDFVRNARVRGDHEVEVTFAASPALRRMFDEITAAHDAGMSFGPGPTAESLLRGRHARDPEDSPHTPYPCGGPWLDEYAHFDAARTPRMAAGSGKSWPAPWMLDYLADGRLYPEAPRYPLGRDGHVHDETCPPGWNCPMTDVMAESWDTARRGGVVRPDNAEEALRLMEDVRRVTPTAAPVWDNGPPPGFDPWPTMWQTGEPFRAPTTSERMPQPTGRTGQTKPRPGARPVRKGRRR